MATEDDGYWPRRTWVAGALLAGELVAPVALLAICKLAASPVLEPVGPRTVSAAEYVAGGLFLAHVVYSIGLVVLMRGWRFHAVGVGFVVLPFAAVAALAAALAVGGVYP